MKADAVIKGVVPTRGVYLVHRGRVKTQGRVLRVKVVGVVWFSNESGVAVSSDPDGLREGGYEWSDAPLADYVVRRPFPHVAEYPEVDPETIGEVEGEAAAMAHAEKGDTTRAAAIFAAIGNQEAADFCRRSAPRWR